MVNIINRKTKRFIGQIKRLLGFAFKMDITPRALIVPALIGLAVAVLEGVYVALLYPIMKHLYHLYSVEESV